ncbi:MAG: Hsp70 family protein [Acidimicrobiales bacterium]
METSARAYDLGIDLGATYVAAGIVEHGRPQIITLGDRAAVVPAVLYFREDGQVLTGDAARRRGQADPTRLVREFKRRVGDTTPVVVGGSPYPVAVLMAELLRFVHDTVVERQGAEPRSITLTHPANWGPYRIDVLEQAVGLAGLGRVAMLAEPVAAAVHFAAAERLAPGQAVAVYDLGGGTFDAAVLLKTADGFEVLGEAEGIERLGGVDFDEAVFQHVLRFCSDELESLDPNDLEAIQALAQLRRECVEAKEILSTDTEVTIPVVLPGHRTEVRLTRAEFEAMIRPLLQQTIEALRRAVQSASLSPQELSAVLLVGGSSRIPLVAEVVGAELGRPIAVDRHPKHTVALGAAIWAGRGERDAPAARVDGWFRAEPTSTVPVTVPSRGAPGRPVAGNATAAPRTAASAAATAAVAPSSPPPATPSPAALAPEGASAGNAVASPGSAGPSARNATAPPSGSIPPSALDTAAPSAHNTAAPAAHNTAAPAAPNTAVPPSAGVFSVFGPPATTAGPPRRQPQGPLLEGPDGRAESRGPRMPDESPPPAGRGGLLPQRPETSRTEVLPTQGPVPPTPLLAAGPAPTRAAEPAPSVRLAVEDGDGYDYDSGDRLEFRPEPSPTSPRLMLLVGLGIVAVLVLGGAVWALNRDDPDSGATDSTDVSTASSVEATGDPAAPTTGGQASAGAPADQGDDPAGTTDSSSDGGDRTATTRSGSATSASTSSGRSGASGGTSPATSAGTPASSTTTTTAKPSTTTTTTTRPTTTTTEATTAPTTAPSSSTSTSSSTTTTSTTSTTMPTSASSSTSEPIDTSAPDASTTTGGSAGAVAAGRNPSRPLVRTA